MGVVNQAIEYRIGIGWVAYGLMPRGHGKLRRHDRRTPAVALLDDFEQVAAGAGVERLDREVVQQEHVGAAERPKQAGMAAVAARPCLHRPRIVTTQKLDG